MLRHAFDDLIIKMMCLFVVSVIFVPLGVWKAIEIIIWVFKHLRIVIN